MKRFGLLPALLLSIAVALLLSPLASDRPDGLERLAGDLGFEKLGARKPLVSAPVAGYAMPGIKSPVWSTALAGTAGTLGIFGCVWLAGKLLTRSRKKNGTPFH